MPDAPLGILGGTFDPVHRAHLHLARAALAQLRLGGVLWIPAGQPSHRQAPHAAAAHRLAMVRLATAGEPRFAVDDAEATVDAPSFTVPTLERLRRRYGAARPFVLLVGADAFLGLPSWHRWREVFELAHIAVAARPGAELQERNMSAELAEIFRARRRGDGAALAAAPAGAIVGFEIEPVEPPDLSATAVRALLRERGDDAQLADLLPLGVLDYIRGNHLYLA
ncbi:MAG: nicotinate-nucleotide adenylyltransferase [Rhodocyclaceae bacterium]|nr:nicotinate-nucleotide adenylyltransferase [Rhodocyclaceae bacterium]